MSFKMGLAQVAYPQDGDVVAQADGFAAQAKREGVALLAFPENFMYPRDLKREELRASAESVEGPFVRALADVARNRRLWLAFTMNEANPAGGPPFNTAAIVDDAGEIRGVYRKCHLYDALGVHESQRMAAGDALADPVKAPFGTIGVAICYDLRFPEVARHLALGGCDLILYPAAWHAGPGKLRQWKTLLQARAIENECFVAGICRADARYVGTSLVCDPLGRVLGETAEPKESLLVCDIDLDAVDAARVAMPVFDHRRPELYL